MDSVSQIVLGAGVAEAVLGKKAGNRAILWGAIAGTIPDLDIIPAKMMDTVGELDFHRSVTHSLLFSLVLAPLLAWLVYRLYKGNYGSFKGWTWLFFLVLVTHALLDCFTTWGTQLFWPLEHRIAWKTIFVIDPFYTLPFLVCLIWLMTKPRQSAIRRKLIVAGLAISTFYLGITVFNKWQANQVFEQAFESQEMNIIRYDSRPTPLQSILWTVNAETPDAFYIGFYSFFDDDKQIDFHRYEKNQNFPAEVANTKKIQKLQQLTEGWYNLEQLDSNRWVMNDFRFGKAGRFETGEGEFVFAYEIEYLGDGKVKVSQRETSVKAGKEMIKGLWDRVRGIKDVTE